MVNLHNVNISQEARTALSRARQESAALLAKIDQETQAAIARELQDAHALACGEARQRALTLLRSEQGDDAATRRAEAPLQGVNRGAFRLLK